MKKSRSELYSRAVKEYMARHAADLLTSNLRWADAPGNVLLASKITGLPKDSVANVSRVTAIDKNMLTDRVGKLSDAKLELVHFGLDLVFGR